MTGAPASRAAPRRAPLRVLVVDDSAANRQAIAAVLSALPEVEVVGCAADGEEGLRLALELVPACICLDLEMPRMDGFTFLRLLMVRQPTPVIVISSSSSKQDVFKALELGALDFVAKPDPGHAAGDLARIRDDLQAKIAIVRALRMDRPAPPPAPEGPPARRAPAEPGPRAPEVRLHAVTPPPRPSREAPPRPEPVQAAAARAPAAAARLVVIGASTGGPAALGWLLSALPRDVPLAFAVAQHMPRRFTGGFAERLRRTSGFDVREADDGDEVLVGRVLVAPGGRHLRLVRAGGPGAPLRASVAAPDPRDGRRYCPSVDALFESAAEAGVARLCAVVLTGMGNDGRAGIARVKEAGGLALAESERSAVVFGMPREAVDSGKVDEVLALEAMVARLCRFAEEP